MQAPQSLEDLERAITGALENKRLVELQGWLDARLATEAADELLNAIKEAQLNGTALSPCQRLTGDWLLQFLQRYYDVSWRT